jgi:hypothetical protein
VPSYPAGMTVSNRALNMLTDALRHRRRTIGTRWRRLEAGQQPCWSLRTCAMARPTPIWPAVSGSARRRCSATSARLLTSWPPWP